MVEVESEPGDGLVRLVRERLAAWSVEDLRALTAGLRRLVDDLATPAPPPDTTPATTPRKNA
jgi:hypothetical protein